MSTKDLLETRGHAIYETWLQEIDPRLADVTFFADPIESSKLNIVKLKNVKDKEYPPQRKSFSMLAYFHDYCIDKYDWFIRLDDDTVLQWENLYHFFLTI